MLMLTKTPQDPVFPFLAQALDRDALARTFDSALCVSGFATKGLTCAIERSRIKRGRKAIIGVCLRGWTVAGRPFVQHSMIALFPEGDATALPDMSNGACCVSPNFGPATLNLPNLAGRAWFFPNDRKVHHIAQLLSDMPGEVDLVHYVPEQGCTVRVVQADGRQLYGKCRADDRGLVAAKVHAAASRAEGVRLAPVLSYDRAHRILWQEAVAGQPLNPADVCARPHYWASRIAGALKAFHGIKPPKTLKHLTYASIGTAVQRRLDRMTDDLPDFALRLTKVAEQLRVQLPVSKALVLAHGDMHAGNLLWDGDSFALIDLDTAALAPCAVDHGTLAATMVHKAIEADIRDVSIVVMLDRLRKAAHDEIGDDNAFDWCVAASLLGERLYRCTTRLKSPRLMVRERLLAQAEQLVMRNA
jgi:hypothetical protein